MTPIEELEKQIEESGILGISGGIFKDHETPSGLKKKANSTVREYCESLSSAYDMSPEEYAQEMLNIINAPAKNVIGECHVCAKTLVEGEDENHKCPEEMIKEYEKIQKLFQEALDSTTKEYPDY